SPDRRSIGQGGAWRACTHLANWTCSRSVWSCRKGSEPRGAGEARPAVCDVPQIAHGRQSHARVQRPGPQVASPRSPPRTALGQGNDVGSRSDPEEPGLCRSVCLRTNPIAETARRKNTGEGTATDRPMAVHRQGPLSSYGQNIGTAEAPSQGDRAYRSAEL